MTDRELRASIRARFKALRAAVYKRHRELIAETEKDLLDQFHGESQRVKELNRRLKDITDDANQKVVAALREFEDLADGGPWRGIRHATFEVPRISQVRTHLARRHRASIADIDRQTQRALQVLDRQQASLLASPDRARTLMARGAPAIDTGLIPPTRLWDVALGEVPLDSAASA